MKSKWLLVAVLICLVFVLMIGGGCQTMSTATAINRENLLKLTIGISRKEALDTMGTEDFIATYWPPGSGLARYLNVTISNPYRSEVLQGKEKTFEIIYYVTDVKRDDGAITDDELTPLVFDDGKLIGWGWSFLEANVQKYEIRIR